MGQGAAGWRSAALSLLALAWLTLATSEQTRTAEIKVPSSNATKSLLEDLGPMFERARGRRSSLRTS